MLERVAIPREDRPDLLALLRSLGCAEAVLPLACSRVEILSQTPCDVLANDGTAGPDLADGLSTGAVMAHDAARWFADGLAAGDAGAVPLADMG